MMQIPDLHIEVTPATEDAFHFLYGLEKGVENMTDAQVRCGENLREKYSPEDVKEGVRNAYRMIENIGKYGIPCIDWT